MNFCYEFLFLYSVYLLYTYTFLQLKKIQKGLREPGVPAVKIIFFMV